MVFWRTSFFVRCAGKDKSIAAVISDASSRTRHFSLDDGSMVLTSATMQKAISVNPTFGGTTSLDLAELASLLADGWIVVQTEPSTNGAILVILQKGKQLKEPFSG